MTDTVVLVPVLGRPDRAQQLVDSFREYTPARARLLFIGTEGDVDELRAVHETGADLLVLPLKRQRGDYARKINYGYRNTTEPFLFLAADDLTFHRDWLERAIRKVSDQIQVVGTNDMANKRVMSGAHSTHTLVTRAYCDRYGTIDEPGSVLCERYNHWYVDDEFIQTAQHRGMFASALNSKVEHLHYFVGKSQKDKTYRVGESRRVADRQTYAARCGMWGRNAAAEKPKITIDPTTGILRAVIGE